MAERSSASDSRYVTWLPSLKIYRLRLATTTHKIDFFIQCLKWKLITALTPQNSNSTYKSVFTVKSAQTRAICLWARAVKQTVFPASFFYKSHSHQGKKEVACIVSNPLVSCLWEYGESVNPPKLNIQEVQGALSSRPKRVKGLLPIFRIFDFCQNTPLINTWVKFFKTCFVTFCYSIGSIPTPEGYKGSVTPSSDEVETIDEQGRLPTPRLRDEGVSKRHHLDLTTPATGTWIFNTSGLKSHNVLALVLLKNVPIVLM